ncbi:endonuclease/exonuclease/phosphatase family protein [Marinibaculum pumilum]|uniref:Endonuclease/exonuclease/phosphatase family protein n=1 Tax=Marinibaculum pumilum TaxID=1766165 RepID=A0ABV7L948_9PROT
MPVTLASYNMHFGIGTDGRYDMARLADAVAAADIVCLQEVTQGWPQTGHEDQLATLATRLDRHAVFGPMLSLDASTRDSEGGIVQRRSTFGNAILSRWPIRHARTVPLPKATPPDSFDLQRVALEGVIEVPGLPLRVYSVHLSDIAPGQRRLQVDTLRDIVAGAAAAGRPWDGTSPLMEFLGYGPFEVPQSVAVLGDFNFTPQEANYPRLLAPAATAGHDAAPDGSFLVDAWDIARARGVAQGADRTYALGPEAEARIDYCFLDAGLAGRVERAWIDSAAQGSDHYPLFVTLESRSQP